MIKKISYLVIIIVLLITIFHPGRHAKHYNYIGINEIHLELVYNNNNDSNLKMCSYTNLISNNKEISVGNNVFTKYNFLQPNKGGEFIPNQCMPVFKVAILIPYRNRKEQLNIFLNYMHHFLQAQNIQYRIFVIEQNDSLPFNRARMFNTGALAAMKLDYPCLILHDVDLLPLTTGNLYACTRKPRHMSSSLDTFRFNLPYEGLFGGVISIQTDQFQRINGMSNLFSGWGGEDDDLYSRLYAYKITPYRFAPEFSKYTMLKHQKAKPSGNRFLLLETSVERQRTDGLNSLSHLTITRNIVEKRLYTHVFST